MKKIFSAFALIFLVFIAIGWLSQMPAKKQIDFLKPLHRENIQSGISAKMKSKVTEAKLFTKKNHYNNDFCFLIDMSLPSGKKRFFVYDLQHDSVLNTGLVAHGCCNENFLEGRKYGNSDGCGCTSLGKYKIGAAYTGRFGKAFKLYGLENTNDKAFERFVVLHSYWNVPEQETKEEICQSYGCPMVSPGFLKQLDPMISHSELPVLLWIFE